MMITCKPCDLVVGKEKKGKREEKNLRHAWS
jgi:hypothetical protein